MAINLTDVKRSLERQGLYVSFLQTGGLWIAADISIIPDTDIPFSKNVCTLEPFDNHWIARFSVRSPLTSNVRGSLDDLQAIIGQVFQYLITKQVSLWSAFSHVVGDPSSYLSLPEKTQ